MRIRSWFGASLAGAQVAVLSFVVGCGTPERGGADASASPLPSPEPATDAAFTLFHNGKIFVHPEEWPVEALLVEGARVVAAGDEATLRARVGAEAVRTVDLGGGFAVPGLQDAHGHIAGLGELLESVDLAGSPSYDEVIARVAAQASEREPGEWITGRGWDQSLWEDSSFPVHGPLSRAVPEHPVLIRRVDGHSALANQKALEIAGLLDAYPVPEIEGGRVEVDAEGRPTGLLIDTAIGLVGQHVPSAEEGATRRRILAAQERLLAEGLVCVHDMGITPETADVFIELERERLLELRVLAYLWGNDGLGALAAARFPRSEDFDPSSKVRVIGSKLMMDGALGSRGAALLEPYTDAPAEVGLMRMDADAFAARLDEVARAGLQPATHAIGDRANRVVLDAYAARIERDPGFRALRPRVEHAQIVSEADWSRFDELGVIASMQPTHATSDMRWAEDRVGPERIRGAYAWRRLTARAEQLAFGSDFPVEPSNPLLGLYAARTRTDPNGNPTGGWIPGQRLDGREALAAFTMGAARAGREEDFRGLLRPGYFADMTVLDVDPVFGEPTALLQASVVMTVIDGEVVYARDAE